MRYFIFIFFAAVMLSACGVPDTADMRPSPDDDGQAPIKDGSENDVKPIQVKTYSRAGMTHVQTLYSDGTASMSVGGKGMGPGQAGNEATASETAMKRLLSNLRSYPIAYETPHAAEQAVAFNVTLAVDASGDGSAAEGLPQRENITESVATLSNIVDARLSGAAFEIKSSNASTQHLLPHRETVWRWSVEPLQAGDHELYLEIFAKGDEGHAVMLESYADLITVDVAAASPKEKPRLVDDVRIYISILGGIVSLILGMIALNGHRRNRKSED